MDIRNYIAKRKRDEDSESETESDNLSAWANSGWKIQYDTLRFQRKFDKWIFCNSYKIW